MYSYGSVSPDGNTERHISKILYCNSSIISPSSPSPFLWQTFLLSFSPYVSTCLFIIVDMIISLHSRGHWIMTFHEIC